MADEKTARGKPLPKEEVEFVLIGAGEIVAIHHNSRVYPDPQDYQGLAQCQPIALWK